MLKSSNERCGRSGMRCLGKSNLKVFADGSKMEFCGFSEHQNVFQNNIVFEAKVVAIAKAEDLWIEKGIRNTAIKAVLSSK